MQTDPARQTQLQKNRAYRAKHKRDLDASEASTKLYNQAHAQSQVAPVPAAPVPAAPVLVAPVQRARIVVVSEIVAHPTVHHLQVGSNVQVTAAVPPLFALYIGMVGMIRHILRCRVNDTFFLAYVLCFESVTLAAEAMMAAVHAEYFPAGCQELIELVPPGMLLMALETYMTPNTTGKGLSCIGDPVTHKRKRAESEEAQESQKARADQDMHSVVDLLLRAAENIDALEKKTIDKKDLDKEDSDDDSEEEVGRLVIDESDDDIDDDKAK